MPEQRTEQRYMKEEGGLQVLIVDDHTLVRKGIRSMLEDYAGIQIVGEARNGLEAILLVEQLRPRIVLMDVNMPRMDGIEATAQITSWYPDTIIIGLSLNTSAETHETMKRAGAVRLIPKEAATEQLYDAIHEAAKSRKPSGRPRLHLR